MGNFAKVASTPRKLGTGLNYLANICEYTNSWRYSLVTKLVVVSLIVELNHQVLCFVMQLAISDKWLAWKTKLWVFERLSLSCAQKSKIQTSCNFIRLCNKHRK